MKKKTPKERACAYLGSASALARELGITKGAVSQWSGEIPAEHCPTIERLTNGKLKCEEMNTKTDWKYLRLSKASSS